jgi:hypothetical protein
LHRSLPGVVIQCVASLQCFICGPLRWRNDWHGEALSKSWYHERESVVDYVRLVLWMW